MLIGPIELIKQSLELYQKNFKKILPYILFLLIPAFVLIALAVGLLFIYAYAEAYLPFISIVIFIVFLASSIYSIWVKIALAKTIKACYENQNPGDCKQMFTSSWHLIWPAILITILVILIMIGGYILFIIPGVIFMIWFIFVFYAVVLDEKKVIESLSFSKNLVVGRWWPIVLRLILPLILFGLIIIISDSIFNTIVSALISSQTWQLIASIIINSIVNTFAAPLIMISLVILYVQAKNNPISTTPIKK
ncbi:MAG: hypothetical protein ABIH87_02060 [bacterium]